MEILIITPVRNEERFIRNTIECMIAQTVSPSKWVIVDDGSTDSTGRIVEEYLTKNAFMHYVSIPDRGYRKPAQGVIEAFYEGYKRIGDMRYDIIAKFDGDLRFPPDMLERISNAFENDPKLGITGGTRYEQRNEKDIFKKVLVPKGFVGGPYKFYRKKCFEDIDGLLPRAGWDGVDIIRANMKGWNTGEIDSLKIDHLKPTGTSDGAGLRRACEKYGDVSYYMGGYLWYFILRIIGRSLYSRSVKVGIYMIKGYLNSLQSNCVREPHAFRSFLKSKQKKYIIYWIKYGFRDFCERIKIYNRRV